MTFFPLTSDLHSRVGERQVRRIAFAISKGTLPYRKNQLDDNSVSSIEDNTIGASALFFNDPHNLSIALVES